MQGGWEGGSLPAWTVEEGCRSLVGAAAQSEVVATLQRVESSQRDWDRLLTLRGSSEANQELKQLLKMPMKKMGCFWDFCSLCLGGSLSGLGSSLKGRGGFRKVEMVLDCGWCCCVRSFVCGRREWVL